MCAWWFEAIHQGSDVCKHPLLTSFLYAEKVWPDLKDQVTNQRAKWWSTENIGGLKKQKQKNPVISKDGFSNENTAQIPRDAKRNLVGLRSQGFGPLTLYIIFQTCILITWKYLKKK